MNEHGVVKERNRSSSQRSISVSSSSFSSPHSQPNATSSSSSNTTPPPLPLPNHSSSSSNSSSSRPSFRSSSYIDDLKKQRSFRTSPLNFWHKYVPITYWLPRYNWRRDLKNDIIAGICVGILNLPQTLSHASIMGVPPQYALYCAVVPMFLYSFFATSRDLSMGNTSISALLVASSMSQGSSEEDKIAIGILITFFAGIVQCIMGILRLGFIVDFFSRPVMTGFVSGASFIVILDQLKNILGLRVKKYEEAHYIIIELGSNITKTDPVAFSFGVLSIIYLVTLKKTKQSLKNRADKKKLDRGEEIDEVDDLISYISTAEQVLITPTPTRRPHTLPRIVGEHVASQIENTPRSDSPHSTPYSSVITLGGTTGGGGGGGDEHMILPKHNTSSSSSLLLWSKRSCCCCCCCNSLCCCKGLFKIFKLLVDFGSFILTILAIIFSYIIATVFHYRSHPIAGNIQMGLPIFRVPWEGRTWGNIRHLLLESAIIGVVTYMAAIAVAKKIALAKGYEINPNQEALATGIAQLVGSFFQSMPISCGLSRTSVNMENAASQLAGIITSLIAMASLLFIMPIIYYLPKSVLAAMVIISSLGLLDFEMAIWLYKVNRPDFYVWVVAFLATCLTGVKMGLLISLAGSLVAIVHRTTHPKITVLGNLANTNAYVSMDASVDVQEVDGLFICRIESSLYFANCDYIQKWLIDYGHQRYYDDGVRFVIIDASTINSLDASAVQALETVVREYRKLGMELLFANARLAALDVLNAGLKDQLVQKDLSMDVHMVILSDVHLPTHHDAARRPLSYITRR